LLLILVLMNLQKRLMGAVVTHVLHGFTESPTKQNVPGGWGR
jgi:hypothetical protein